MFIRYKCNSCGTEYAINEKLVPVDEKFNFLIRDLRKCDVCGSDVDLKPLYDFKRCRDVKQYQNA